MSTVGTPKWDVSYPHSEAERKKIRDKRLAEGAKQGQVKERALFSSMKCSGNEGYATPHHAGELGGCKNDGSNCLCECHDE